MTWTDDWRENAKRGWGQSLSGSHTHNFQPGGGRYVSHLKLSFTSHFLILKLQVLCLKTQGAQSFACLIRMLKGRLSTLATNAKGTILRLGGVSASDGNSKGYLGHLDICEGCMTQHRYVTSWVAVCTSLMMHSFVKILLNIFHR